MPLVWPRSERMMRRPASMVVRKWLIPFARSHW